MHGASQHPNPLRGVSNSKRPHSEVACAPELLPTFDDLSFRGLNDEQKLRLWNDFGRFGSACVHTVSATLSVKVNVVYVPFLSIDYIVNRLQYDSVRQSFAGWLEIAVTRNITSSMQMARRKTWPEGVAERCDRKAWLKGVVLKRACRNRGRRTQLAPCRVSPVLWRSVA